MASATAKRVFYTNLRVLESPRMCGICVESPSRRLNGAIRPAKYSVDEHHDHVTFVREYFCVRHLPTHLRRLLPREAILRRYPRLVRAMQYAAILSESEAIGAIRDVADEPRFGGGEAVVHYGGPAAAIAGALRCRGYVRRGVQNGHIIPYRPCVTCGEMTALSDGICSSKCAAKGPGA